MVDGGKSHLRGGLIEATLKMVLQVLLEENTSLPSKSVFQSAS